MTDSLMAQEVREIPEAAAMLRMLQWLAFAGLLRSVMSTTLPIVSTLNGFLRPGRLASLTRPAMPLSR